MTKRELINELEGYSDDSEILLLYEGSSAYSEHVEIKTIYPSRKKLKDGRYGFNPETTIVLESRDALRIPCWLASSILGEKEHESHCL